MGLSPSRPCPAPTISSCIPDKRFSKTCHLAGGCPSFAPPRVPRRRRELPAARPLPGSGAGSSALSIPTRAAAAPGPVPGGGLAASPPTPPSPPRPTPCPPPERFAVRQRGNSFPLALAGGRGRCRRSGGARSGGLHYFPGQLQTLLPFRAAETATGPAGSCSFPLCLCRSRLTPPLQPPRSFCDSRPHLSPSLFFRPSAPSPPRSCRPQALRSSPPYRPPYSGVSPVGPAPPVSPPAPPGSLMPRPVGRVVAGLNIPGRGRAGLGLFTNLSLAGSSALIPHPQHSPRLEGPSRSQAEDTPHLSLLPSARISTDAARMSALLRREWSTARRRVSPEGCRLEGDSVRGSAVRGMEPPRGLHPGGFQSSRDTSQQVQLGGASA